MATTTASIINPASPSALNMLDPISLHDTLQTGILLAETEPWVQPLYSILDPFFNLFSFAMVSSIVVVVVVVVSATGGDGGVRRVSPWSQ